MSTDTKVITARMAYHAMEEVVEEYGEGMVAGSRYVETDVGYGEVFPICLVGHALVRLGVNPLVLAVVNERAISSSDVLSRLYWGDHTRVTNGAVDVLRSAQKEQDDGGDWGAALTMASGSYHALKDQGLQDSED